MSNHKLHKHPQTIILRCSCCQQVKYALCYFNTKGEAEYHCECGYTNKIKLIK